MTGKIWVCKVGEDMPKGNGADAPMRKAIAKAYEEVTGVPPTFIFSGWGGKLTECERAVVENREPLEPFDEDEYNNEMDRLRARVAELEAALAKRDSGDERDAALGRSIQRACGELPEGFSITIDLENGAATVTMDDPFGNNHEDDCGGEPLSTIINCYIDDAILAAKVKT